MQQKMSLGSNGVDWVRSLLKIQRPMGWIGCIHCEKFGNDFVAQTFALIAPVQPILLRVSCCKEMVPNAPKHYETRQ